VTGVPLPPACGEVASSRTLGGGDIARTWRVTTTTGRDLVVKQTPYDARLEADGLLALAAAGAPVPEVVHADAAVLVMTAVSGRPDWAGLGARLAAVHATTGTDFGWDRDNVIGPLPQPNGPMPHWGEFFATRRVRPWLDAPALPRPVRARLEVACAGPLPDLLDHDPPAALVHGDLWSGNVVDGAYLIDPAVHRADRELDLAFARVFGGFPPEFFDAYQAAWPLPAGWQDRLPALQLHHLLVHVKLFGSGYVGAVVTRLEQLGW
jgi:fructosamine-3-kinase